MWLFAGSLLAAGSLCSIDGDDSTVRDDDHDDDDVVLVRCCKEPRRAKWVS